MQLNLALLQIHFTHWNGFSPLCSLSWYSRLAAVLSIFPQWLHLNLGSSCVAMWIRSCATLGTRFPHCLHLYFSSVLWTRMVWHLSWDTLGKVLLQMEQNPDGFIPSWMVLPMGAEFKLTLLNLNLLAMKSKNVIDFLT